MGVALWSHTSGYFAENGRLCGGWGSSYSQVNTGSWSQDGCNMRTLFCLFERHVNVHMTYYAVWSNDIWVISMYYDPYDITFLHYDWHKLQKYQRNTWSVNNMQSYIEMPHAHNKTADFDSGYHNWLVGSDHDVVVWEKNLFEFLCWDTRWVVRGSNPGGGEIFCTRPDRPWGPPSLLYNGYRVFPRGKAAGAWRWPPTPI
jgi:hypothetical protein